MPSEPPPMWTRKRKLVAFTLSDEARAKLERLASEYGSKSAVVEAGVMALPEKKTRAKQKK